MVPSRGQAALLAFCTCISLASVPLVLTITFPDLGNNWFWLTVLSPLAGAYYWQRATRKEQIKVKMKVSDDGTLTEIIVQGDGQQVEQMRKELQLSEKGQGVRQRHMREINMGKRSEQKCWILQLLLKGKIGNEAVH